MTRRFDRRLFALLLAVASIPVIGALDVLTGLELDFSVFYTAPLVLAGWYLSRRMALALSVAAAATWLIADLLARSVYPGVHVEVWNAAFELLTYLAVTWAVGWMRAQHDHLVEAASQIRQLKGLLPVCAWCHRVRSDEGYWLSVDSYLRRHTDVQVTHGICPECAARQMSELS